MANAIHTSDLRHFKRLWLSFGGSIRGICRTGEVRYDHPMFDRPVRANDRRCDVPAVLMSRLNQVKAACDATGVSNQLDVGSAHDGFTASNVNATPGCE